MTGAYVPIAQVLKSTFRRACAVVDLPVDAVTDEDLEEIMKAFKAMKPREGLKKCYDGLREAGWDVYGVTNGGSETSLNYYRNAGIELDEQHLLSCDAIQVAKPDVRVYENAQRHLDEKVKHTGSLGKGEGARWFIAAHAWDLIAARKAGFHTAYLDFGQVEGLESRFLAESCCCDDNFSRSSSKSYGASKMSGPKLGMQRVN